MKGKIILSLLVSFNGSILSAYPSLFFSPEELDHIHECLLGNVREKLKNSKDLSFSALIYVDEKHWALWINNKLIRPSNEHKIEGFHLEKVMPRGIKFARISDDASKPAIFTLHPFQSNKQASVE